MYERSKNHPAIVIWSLGNEAGNGINFERTYDWMKSIEQSRPVQYERCLLYTSKFYDNTTCVFDSSQQTFPKLLQKAGYQTALVGKWHLESLPTGFNYWEIVPGQGDYYNPRFITMQNDTIEKQGYLTNLITDMSIDWMENQRDKDKPFCILIHHKAIHRNWLPELKYLNEYEDKTFTMPDNFYDDYEGRPAAAAPVSYTHLAMALTSVP